MHLLLKTWKSFQAKDAPFILPGDEAILSDSRLYCRYSDWKGFVSNREFGAPGDSQFHLDLLPMPFVGNLKSARVFLLMLNPGFGPHDYFGEYQVPEYRSALIDNLHQVRSNTFFFLDPKFSWHGGFEYWHTKLQKLIAEFAKSMGTLCEYGEARRFFQSNVAAIELMPYHSMNSQRFGRMFNSFHSVELARAFVHEELLPRAKSGDCLLVVTRAVKYWRLPKKQITNVIVYKAAESRSAHLSPNSRGGKAILRFLRSA